MRKFISAVTSLAVAASMASVLVPASAVAEDTVKGLSLEAFAEADSKYSKMGSNITVSAEDIAAGDVTIPCALYIDETTISHTIGASWIVNGGADAEKITAKMYKSSDSYWAQDKDYTIASGETFKTKNYVSFAGSYDDFEESFTNAGLMGSCVAKQGQKGVTENYYMNVGVVFAQGYTYTGNKSTDHPVVVFDVTLPKGIAAGEYSLDFTSFNTTGDPAHVNPATMVETTERFTEENGKLKLQNMTITVEGKSNPDDKTTTTTTTTTTKKPDTTTTTTKPVGDADIIFDFGNYEAKPGDKIKVPVTISPNGNSVSAMHIQLKQDSPIKLTNIGKSSPAFSSTLLINEAESSFEIITLDSEMKPMKIENGGTVFTLGYEVPADCPDGVYEIGFDVANVTRDNSSYTYKSAKVNGFITVGDVKDTTTTTTVTTTTTTSKTTTTTTSTTSNSGTTTTQPSGDDTYTPDWGDTNCDGVVNISDVVILNRWLHDETSITISDQGKVNADCCDPQDAAGGKVKASSVDLTVADSTAIIESIVHLVTLPVASK